MRARASPFAQLDAVRAFYLRNRRAECCVVDILDGIQTARRRTERWSAGNEMYARPTLSVAHALDSIRYVGLFADIGNVSAVELDRDHACG